MTKKIEEEKEKNKWKEKEKERKKERKTGKETIVNKNLLPKINMRQKTGTSFDAWCKVD